MKTYTPKQKNKLIPFLIAGGIVVLLIAGSLVYVYGLGGNLFGWTAQPSATDSSDTSTTPQDPSGNDKKQDLISNDDSDDQNPVTPSNITLSATQTDNEVTITTKLVGYSDGECALVVGSDNGSLTRNAEIIYQPEFSTCAGFSIDTAELGKGTWNISLTVTSGSSSDKKELSLEVK